MSNAVLAKSFGVETRPHFSFGTIYSAAAPKKMRLTLPSVKLKMMPP
jgi:hypothetical protein